MSAGFVIAYLGMLVFDATVIAGTVWLIGWHDWSSWWMLFALLLCSANNPRVTTTTTKKES